MNVIDVLVVVIVGGLGVVGFWRGFVKEAIETIGTSAAALLTYRLYEVFAKGFGVLPTSGWSTKLVLGASLFIGIMMVFSAIGYVGRRFLRVLNLGLYDHMLGMVLGALKGAIVVAVVGSALLWIAPRGQRMVEQSRLLKADLVAFNIFSGLFPDAMRGSRLFRLAARFSGNDFRGSALERLRMPLVGLDSLPANVPKDAEAVNRFLQSLIDSSTVCKSLLGEFVMWDKRASRGMVRVAAERDTLLIPCYYGSFASATERRVLAAGDSIAFRAVYSDFLGEVCAIDISSL